MSISATKIVTTGVLSVLVILVASGCASSEDTEEKTETESSPYIEAVAMEESAEGGGCSNAQIRDCYYNGCGGTVHSCNLYGSGTSCYVCECKNDRWSLICR